ncbi:hypothetical protein ACFW1M_21600 [Streptomyces inhibens]|uniref:hypothetical protein n=1 Tax=Streptomyces inhibens TaxID=2293571 RepID=UPI0036A2A0B0
MSVAAAGRPAPGRRRRWLLPRPPYGRRPPTQPSTISSAEACGDLADAYANRVFVIEYEKKDFAAACRAWAKRLSLILRDRDVRPAGSAGHVDQRC